MIRNRQSLLQFNQYVIVAVFAAICMFVGAVGYNPGQAAAATCNVVLQDPTLPGKPKAYYYDPGFYDGRCVNGDNPFPNTGWPYSSDGNVDSVGYVIPREYKSADYNSEALANVGTKQQFYDKLRHHYFDRVVPGTQEGYWAKDGAAFVVFSFIGKNPPANRNLSDADWAELKRRLDNPSLTMELADNYNLWPNSGAIYDTAGRLDFTHFTDEFGLKGPALIFKQNGVTVASIERKCANLLGKFELPAAPPWTTTAESKVGVQHTPPNVNDWTPAKRGQTLYWRHNIFAEGGTTPKLTFSIEKSGFDETPGANVWGNGASPANHSEPSGTTSEIGAGSSFGIGWGTARPDYSEYLVRAADGGRTLCQSVRWGPIDYTKPSNNRESSDPACATVPFDYNLIPSVSAPNGTIAVGAPIKSIMPKVENKLDVLPGQTTDSPPVRWELKRIEVPPTDPPAPRLSSKLQAENKLDPCTHYGYTDCTDKGSGTKVFIAGSSTVPSPTDEMVGRDTPVGTQICYTLSVQPYTHTAEADEWRHSQPVCLTVSKQPKVQVWGHDFRTRGIIDTGVATVNDNGTDKLFGSWVEYGGFSVGVNSGFASGSGLNNGNANTVNPDAWHQLTFANIDEDKKSNFGSFTSLADLPNLSDQFIGTPTDDTVNSDLSAVESGTYYVDADVTLNGGEVGTTDAGKGKTIIIVSTETVTITGNITYKDLGGSDAFTAIDQLSQVIIIAPKIDITNAVTQIDAWLLTTGASGTINTCSDLEPTVSLNSKVCNNQLTVNGPVVTQKLYLRRTAGSDTVAQAGTPAEVFNLRPDTYLWAYARAGQAGKAQTVYSVELPPRF